MKILSGTSGYAYDSWTPSFYPEALAPSERLPFYAQRLPAVEFNNTFYRVPKAAVVRSWADQTPEAFAVTLKATRRLTHILRLRNPGETLGFVHRSSLELGPRLRAVLFQTPPNLPADLPLLEDFLGGVPQGWPVAFEFRHPSWAGDGTYEALSRHGAAWVAVDDEKVGCPLVRTAPWTYVRLRRPDYDQQALGAWVERILALDISNALVFFKHEDRAPELATRFLEILSPRGQQPDE